MALGTTRVTFQATVLGVAGDPPLLHWRDLGEGPNGMKRPLSGAEAFIDTELLAAAREIPSGSSVKLTVVTDWDKQGLPSHIEAFEIVAQPEKAAA